MSHNPSHGQPLEESRAVSPVIGVVLMVAITVVLAASIGMFVMDTTSIIGHTAPQPSLSITDSSVNFDSDDLEEQAFVEISHRGGDKLTIGEIRILIRNSSTQDLIFRFDRGDKVPVGTKGDWNVTVNNNRISPSTPLRPGSVLEIKYDDNGHDDVADSLEYDILIIHDPSGDLIADSRVLVR